MKYILFGLLYLVVSCNPSIKLGDTVEVTRGALQGCIGTFDFIGNISGTLYITQLTCNSKNMMYSYLLMISLFAY